MWNVHLRLQNDSNLSRAAQISYTDATRARARARAVQYECGTKAQGTHPSKTRRRTPLLFLVHVRSARERDGYEIIQAAAARDRRSSKTSVYRFLRMAGRISFFRCKRKTRSYGRHKTRNPHKDAKRATGATAGTPVGGTPLIVSANCILLYMILDAPPL